MDHNIVTVLLALILLVLGFIGFMGRGWISHVNKNLESIWEKLDTDAEKREERWDRQHNTCKEHGERLAKVEAKVNGYR